MSEDNSVITEPEKPAKKRKKKGIKSPKLIAVLVVVVVVIVAGGAGFSVWHKTPSFCGAICHNPQDPFNPTYYAEPGQPTTDKWGNEVANARGMLAPVHRVQADANCLSCHEPTIAEQMTEGLEWVTGNFYNPLSERSIANLTRWHDDADPVEFCLRPGCHGASQQDLTNLFADMSRNPHSWHHSEYTCSDCHKSHRASVMVCSQCHDDYYLPEGWITWQEAQQLGTTYLSYDQEQRIYGD